MQAIMNQERRRIIYNNVKQFSSNPKKCLRFNLNPNLEREECLKEDIKLLKSTEFKPLSENESEVQCENFIQDSPDVIVLTEGQLWDFVYSDDWSGYSSIRICEGRLLDTILQYLFVLVNKRTLKTYKMSKFDSVTRPIVATPIKTIQQKSSAALENMKLHVPVKIKFTYYGINSQTQDNKAPQIPTVSLSQDAVMTITSNPNELRKRKDSSMDPKILFSKSKSDHSCGSAQSVASTKSFASVSECGDSVSSLNVKNNSSPLEVSSSEKMQHSKAKVIKSSSSVSRPLQGSCDFFSAVSSHSRTKSGDSKSKMQPIPKPMTPDYPRSLNYNASVYGKSDSYPYTSKEKPFITLSLPSKISDVQSMSMEQRANAMNTVKKTISAELIVNSVVFETDYDKMRSKSSRMIDAASSSSNNTNILEKKKESRIHLTDPEEHVICSEDEYEDNYITIRDIMCHNKWKSTDRANEDKSKAGLQKCVSFKSISPTESEISQPKVPKIKSRNASCIARGEAGDATHAANTQSRQNPERTVYLRMIENLKRKRLGKPTLPSICLSSNESIDTQNPSDEKIAGKPDVNNFEELISEYSVKLFKRKKKVKELQDSVPINENKDDVIEMMENFLEMKYIPRLPAIKEKEEKPPIKLHPAPLVPVSPAPSSDLSNESSLNVNLKCFDQRIPMEFKEHLVKACNDFIVRKEQITLSNSWQTVTCVTINRRLPAM